MKICCIGAGYVGGPSMAVLASKCPEIDVTVVDSSPSRIRDWNSDKLPVYEPGLDDIVFGIRGKNLHFSTEIDAAIDAAEMIFVSVNTPTKDYGIGAGMAVDLRYVESCARRIADTARNGKIVVEKSTLPVRTAESIRRVLDSNRGGGRFEVLSNPEFLAEGTAVRDLVDPDRVLIGAAGTESGRAAQNVLLGIYSRWVPRERILTTNIWSSELTKLVNNAFLAQRVSSINSISGLCEVTGADVEEVANALGHDSRIGSKFLRSSVGFGGSCFQKDLFNLVYICEHYGLKEVAEYWRGVIEINDWQKRRFVKRMMSAMFNTLSGKRVAILGFAFKKDTNDTRESPAIYICRDLLEEDAHLTIYDPAVSEQAIVSDLCRVTRMSPEDLSSRITVVGSAYDGLKDAHALAVLTEWDEFAGLDYERVHRNMRKPAFAFDGRNILPHARMRDHGFEVYAVGK